MSDTREIPVLIVGGGPVGLALAADLGWRGIECTLVEQGDGMIYHPRANTVNSRTMEFCRRWGIAEEVRQAGTPPDFPLDIIFCTGLKGYMLARVDRPMAGTSRCQRPLNARNVATSFSSIRSCESSPRLGNITHIKR